MGRNGEESIKGWVPHRDGWSGLCGYAPLAAPGADGGNHAAADRSGGGALEPRTVGGRGVYHSGVSAQRTIGPVSETIESQPSELSASILASPRGMPSNRPVPKAAGGSRP